MGSIGVYIFRTTFGAFLLVLVSLTTLIWMTQALREVDLMTNRGQSVFVFIGITGLIIPYLVLLIAPLSLGVALAHTLNKLATDSEIIVMNAAGMPPFRLFRPFLVATIIVAILVAAISFYIAPEGLRMLRRWLNEVRADLISNIMQPGRFTPVERGLTFFIRERQANGLLIGILVDDQRDEKSRVTILAERGEVIKGEVGSFVLFESGNIQQQEAKNPDPSIVQFDRYAFDLSRFDSSSSAVFYNVRERYVWELAQPDPEDPVYRLQPGQFHAELHDRILAPLYPFAFLAMTFMFLGAPSTTRQSRIWSMVALTICIVGLRVMGFVASIIGGKIPAFIYVQYLLIAATTAGCLYVISRGRAIDPPSGLAERVNALIEAVKNRALTKASARPA